ncbi:uncharacterized protein JN550_006393 [Neoarthrinium moseri]|uniref:uncharacterized protein n=1 Tax=Neoarthrinium moseri TaxID=1658444 RepID=UPI001FDB5B37|nr:uncharacterized protein JN550_006393 [Neoarthrinium moseri]KAI1868477.1 hypothetical protein JN550_006393 [Neoarthrinium moseri]
MYSKTFFVAAVLSGLVVSGPLPGSSELQSREPGKNVAITDAEWARLKGAGLKARESSALAGRTPASKHNVPITDDEYEALKAGGLMARDDNESGLQARDKVMNCGHLVTGEGGSNGHGKWIPVGAFGEAVSTFCNAYVGTDIEKGHETSDTYPIKLTNQKNDKINGPDGKLTFAIYNTEKSGTYAVDYATCARAMKAPLGNHISKRGEDGEEYVYLGKRDNCYGKKHKDYEGGYYKVDGIGAFGSEVYAA